MGSPVTLSGFNNIDFKAIVDIIIKSERQPIDQLSAQKSTEQGRLTAYGSLSSNLSSLKSAFDDLNDSSAYGSLKASASDTSILTATATSSAAKGTFALDVTSIAQPQVTASAQGQFSDINANIIGGGSFKITQNGTTTSINLTGISTLAQLRDAINEQQAGVKASIINDGSAGSPAKPFRLVLTSMTSGIANAFTVDDQTSSGGGTPGDVLNLSTNPISGIAKDTIFTYNGITINSASSAVTEAIPGLSLNILKTGTTTVTVSDDDSRLKDKITSAVNAFNSFNDFAQGQFKLSTGGSSRPPLATDPILRAINRQLRRYITSDTGNSGTIDNLTDLGIKLNQSGKLEVDESVLDSALANKHSDVQAFLFGNSGFATKVSGFIDGYTQSGGSIDNVEKRIQITIDSYSSRIDSMETQLSFRQETLMMQFTAVDQAISQLNSQVNALGGLESQYRLF